MKLDYLNGTPYKIEQPKQMYHFNSDTELLGRFMRLRPEDHVLDIGCNTGALLCYAAYQKPASLTGIDLFEAVIAQAEKNLSLNHLSADLSVCRLQDYQPDHQFDVIVCNPPYFATKKEELKNQNPYLSAARHESFLTMAELFCHVDRLLKKDGAFYIVHRSERIPELLETGAQFHLVPARMRLTYKNREQEPAGVLLCFARGRAAQMRLDPPVYLDDRSTFDAGEGEGR